MIPITLMNASLSRSSSSPTSCAVGIWLLRVRIWGSQWTGEMWGVGIRICRWSFGVWVPGAPSLTSLFEVRQILNLTIENSELVQRGGPSSTAFFTTCRKLRKERSQTRNKTGLFASDFEAEDSPWQPMQISRGAFVVRPNGSDIG